MPADWVASSTWSVTACSMVTPPSERQDVLEPVQALVDPLVEHGGRASDAPISVGRRRVDDVEETSRQATRRASGHLARAAGSVRLSVGLAASRRDCSPRRQCERRSFSVSLRSRRCGLVRCATRLAVPSPRPRARSRARAAAGSAPPARQIGPGARQVLAGYQETDATRAHGRARWLRGLRNAPSCSPDCQRPPRRCAAVQSDQLPSICSGLDAVESQGSSSNGRAAVGDNAFCWPVSRRSGSELGTELRGRSFASGLPRGVMETEG